MYFPRFCHLTVVLRAVPLRCRRAALMSQHLSRVLAPLFDEVIRQRQRRTQILAAMRRPVLRKVGNRFQREVRIGYQVTEGNQRTAVGWHTFIVKPHRAESKR